MLKLLVFVCWIFSAFCAGSWWQQYQYGEVRVFSNVAIPGDPLNYGQKTIDIKFPHDLKVRYIKLPYAKGTYPDEDRPRWVEVLPGGQQKLWLDSLSFEFEPATERKP